MGLRAGVASIAGIGRTFPRRMRHNRRGSFQAGARREPYMNVLLLHPRCNTRLSSPCTSFIRRADQSAQEHPAAGLPPKRAGAFLPNCPIAQTATARDALLRPALASQVPSQPQRFDRQIPRWLQLLAAGSVGIATVPQSCMGGHLSANGMPNGLVVMSCACGPTRG